METLREIEDLESVQASDHTHRPKPLHIFVSYRTDPDAPLASALKRLIENSIEPSPAVFVAGDGGLRPSNVGFKRQLQAAAQDAQAFVAIITNASKDREWIFFEAGAAWGRELVYVPVLVGSRPEDLPSTIGDYQALNSQSKDDMFRLMRSLAEQTGAEVKERFGQRYQAFSKMIAQYLQGGLSEEEPSQPEHDKDVVYAFNLAVQGDVEQSNLVFAKLEEEASDIEERCWIRILKLRAQCKYHEFRRALERIEESLKETSWFNLTMAVEIERPQLRAEFLLKSIAIGRGAASMEARISLARTDFELGASSRAIESLSQILSAKQAGGFSEKASRTLVELCPEWHPTEKLMVYLSGLSGSVPDGYRWIYELAHASSWRVLDLYCSNKFNSFEETGTSANNLGISREAFGLKSLAYEAYSRAFSLGVAVARYNMASLVYHQGVSSAALEALRDHAGTVDSADPGYPYSLRAEIERSVHGERQREAIGLNLGEAQLKVLWALAEKVVSSPRGTGIFPSGRLACKHASITLEKGKMISGDGTPCPTLIPVRLFGDDLFVCGMGGGTAIVAVGVASAEGVFFTNFAEGTGLEWFLWTSKEDLPSTNEIETDTQGEHHFSLSEGSPPALGSSVLLG